LLTARGGQADAAVNLTADLVKKITVNNWC